jgi:hypothetical protein
MRLGGGMMEKRRNSRHNVSRASRIRAAVVVLALVLVVSTVALFMFHHAIQFMDWVAGGLLSASAIFRKPIQLGTVIAGGSLILLLGGLASLDSHWYLKCWQSILKQLKIALPVLRYIVGATVVIGASLLVLAFLPQSGDTEGIEKQQNALMQPVDKLPEQQESRLEQLREPQMLPPTYYIESQNLTAPLANPTLPKVSSIIPPQRPRMAGRNVCDLVEDPTDAEWNACQLDNRKHPNRTGTGGPLCIMIDRQIRCLLPSPLPRPRPPLNILPN